MHQGLALEVLPAQLDLSDQPTLAQDGHEPVNLTIYDQLLQGGRHDH